MLTQVWFEKKKVKWQVGKRIIILNVCGYHQDNFEMNCLHLFRFMVKQEHKWYKNKNTCALPPSDPPT